MDREIRDATSGKTQDKSSLREVRQTVQQTLVVLLFSLGGWFFGYSLAPEFHLVYALLGLLIGFVGSVALSGVILTLIDLRYQRLTRLKFIGVRPWVSVKDNLSQGATILVVTSISVVVAKYRTGNIVDTTLAGYLGFLASFWISGFALMVVGLRRWKNAKKDALSLQRPHRALD